MDLAQATTQVATQLTAQPIPAGKMVMAAVTSGLNGLATILLAAALIQIKRRQFWWHGALMISALLTSAVFLIVYLASKAIFGEVTTSMIAGAAPGWAKGLYFFVLFPHLIAAIGMLPLIFLAVNHAYHRRWDKHRKIAKPTWFIWFYVSISGVLVYWMLYHWLPSFQPAA